MSDPPESLAPTLAASRAGPSTAPAPTGPEARDPGAPTRPPTRDPGAIPARPRGPEEGAGPPPSTSDAHHDEAVGAPEIEDAPTTASARGIDDDASTAPTRIAPSTIDRRSDAASDYAASDYAASDYAASDYAASDYAASDYAASDYAASDYADPRSSAAVQTAPTLAAPRPPARAPARVALDRGALVGRYLVLSPLGEGGMGVVYEAYDPELDRRVALKLLQSTLAGADGRARLLREAQALARLSHPSVVAIFDVGTLGESVWLAMELVDGITLRRWLEEPRGWREIVRVFAEAGEGLAAAHAAGLVHRDVKPDNVMIDRGGRVRVMDFGLARATADDGAPAVARLEASTRATDDGARELVDGEAPSGASRLDQALTQAGAVLGTPIYMAPEQWQGGAIDARTDVFAFCVALWEAIFGVRPFAGATPAAVAAAVIRGRRERAPARPRVPGRLRRALTRGLEREPERRWQAMAPLLAALRRSASRRGQALAAALVAAAALTGGAAAWVSHARHAVDHACADEGAALADTWRAERGTIDRAFAALGSNYARVSGERALATIDDEVAAYRSAAVGLCRIDMTDETWSKGQVEQARECLVDARWSLEAVIELLAGADPAIAQGAVAAAGSLADPALCLDLRALARRPALPTDPGAREAALAGRRRLVRLLPLGRAGRYDEAYAGAVELIAESDALRWPPLAAAARVHAGAFADAAGRYADAEPLLVDGLLGAEAIGDDLLVIDASAALASTVGLRQVRLDEGLRWGRLGLAVVERAGEGRTLREAEVREGLGNVDLRLDRHDDATAEHTRALEIRRAILGVDHPDVALSLVNLAGVRAHHNEFAAAIDLYEEAVSIYARALGDDHPSVALALHGLSRAQMGLGRYAEARPVLERAAAIRRDALGPAHPETLHSLGNLAVLYEQLGDRPAGIALGREVLALQEAALGPDHPDLGNVLHNLGQNLFEAGERPEALALARRSVALQDAAGLGDQQSTGDYLLGLAEIEANDGRLDDAEAHYRRARQIYAATMGDAHIYVAYPLYGLATVAAARGRHREREALLRDALALLGDAESQEDRHLRATVRLNLASALWRTPSERDRAQELHDLACAEYTAIDVHDARACTQWPPPGR
ncbi:MAG: tetratricopeptide repeat protein [Nannocystaceae bacterium]